MILLSQLDVKIVMVDNDSLSDDMDDSIYLSLLSFIFFNYHYNNTIISFLYIEIKKIKKKIKILKFR